ncbi:MAG: 4-(cytidine 5'-diphospho)-2-C-methyl-D-erythritol kinase [Dehalococcoidales bacterium]|nr:4-(cytidine 5'-diphospho)-2-C-methyl-D-erythritol kinase [Dehalococcoidales bacterium]
MGATGADILDLSGRSVMITVMAPAKINLTLEVLAKRTDGFHEIRSVIQTIGLCDRLFFQDGETFECRSDSPGWLAEKSLIPEATRLLRETTGCSRGAVITVEKCIPLVGGLGGDSSDAAATLRGLNQFWELALPQNKLLELARQLGSDVAFFLDGGTALVEGRGELVIPLPPLPRTWVVLVIPTIPQLPEKTKQLYESLKPSHYTDGQITRRMVAKLREGGELSMSLLFNAFENVTFTHFPKLNVYRERMIRAGAPHIHQAGSGPILFTLFKDRTQAEELSRHLKEQKIKSYLAETIPSNKNS